jgi:hypothetical protein
LFIETYMCWTVTDHGGCLKQVLISTESGYGIEDVLVPGHYWEYEKDGPVELEWSGPFPLPDVLQGS